MGKQKVKRVLICGKPDFWNSMDKKRIKLMNEKKSIEEIKELINTI